jgi:hypothetical protein
MSTQREFGLHVRCQQASNCKSNALYVFAMGGDAVIPGKSSLTCSRIVASGGSVHMVKLENPAGYAS